MVKGVGVMMPTRYYRFALKLGWLLIRLTSLALMALAVAKPVAAQSQVPIAYPRIEVGEHAAAISRLSVDKGERWMVTAGHDKTARVWDLNTGRLDRVLRPPAGYGNEGKLYSVAISPDGSRIAVGGFTGANGRTFPVFLFDRGSGKLVGRSQGFSNVAFDLSFSVDGRRLAAVFGLGGGLRILDATELTRELVYDDSCKAGGYGAHFASDGRLVASCYDGYLRLYDAQGRRSGQRRLEGGSRPYGVRFSPNGDYIAVGFQDSTAVQVLSASDLSPLYSPDTGSLSVGKLDNLFSVAWSPDGKQLYAAGRFDREGIHPVLLWSDQGRGAATMRYAAMGTIMGLSALANGRVAYASYSGEWGLLRSDGRHERHGVRPLLEFRDGHPLFRISRDAQHVEFGHLVWSGDRLLNALARFDLATRTLHTDATAELDLKAPRVEGLAVTDWNLSTVPKFNGRSIATFQEHEVVASLAVAANGRSFVLGAQWSLRSFDAAGRQRWTKPVPGIAWSVNLSEDGRFVVAALGDGTIRWYDAASGTERLALFIHAQDKRWVLFTPEGFYEASPGGDAMIGYHLNQGADREGLFIDSAQLAGIFFRPDLITKRMAGDEATIAESVKAVGDVRAVLAGGRPPTVELLSPALTRSDGEVDFSVHITPGGGPVGELKLTINGSEVPARGVAPPGGGVVTQRLRLAPGDNVVGLRAMRADGKVASNEVQMRVQMSAPTQLPVLRVLAVGISQYDDATYRGGVKFAARDAEKLVERLSEGAQGVYRDVDARLMNRRQDTSLARIDEELKALAERARPEDVVVIFLAGHGKAPEGKEYHFIPADFIYDSDQAFNRGRTLSHGRLENVLKNLGAGKRLLILDTCDSGSAVVAGRDGASEQKDALARLMRSTGRYILAAASQQGRALEDGVGGHGVYTTALLEGLAGKAGQPNAPMVDVDALAEYVAHRVPELTRPAGYEQRPMRSAHGENFPLIRRP